MRQQKAWCPLDLKLFGIQLASNLLATVLNDLQHAKYFWPRSCIHHLLAELCGSLFDLMHLLQTLESKIGSTCLLVYIWEDVPTAPTIAKLQFSLWICHLVLLHKQKKNSQFTCLLQTPSNTVWDMSQKNQTNVIHWVISIEVEPVAA